MRYDGRTPKRPMRKRDWTQFELWQLDKMLMNETYLDKIRYARNSWYGQKIQLRKDRVIFWREQAKGDKKDRKIRLNKIARNRHDVRKKDKK